MATKIPVLTIFALITVLFMIIVIGGFFAQAIFGGPEITAAKTIAEQIDMACSEGEGFRTNFNVFLPDSKGVLPSREFFYVAVDKNYLLLLSREEKGSFTNQIADFASCACKKVSGAQKMLKAASQILRCDCNAGNSEIKKIELRNCEDNKIIVCGKPGTGEPRCGRFQFESSEGKESVTFNLERRTESNGNEKLLLNYVANA